MKYVFLFLLSYLLSISSCTTDYIVEDLTGKSVAIISPADSATATTTTPLIWWNKINDATGYRIQIVWPNFTAVQQLVYDTLATGDRFVPTLTPGRTYTWRIRPENGATTGEWVTRKLTIDSTIDLSQQNVVITQPVNNFSTSNSSVTFGWNPISEADLYRIEVRNVSTQAVVTATTVVNSAWSSSFAEGAFEFHIRAEKTSGSDVSPYSTLSFTVDQTGPAAPTLITPADNGILSLPTTVNFDWTSGTDAFTDSLFIATDSLFTTIVEQRSFSGSQGSWAWSNAQATGTGYYYWRLRSYDAAGNASPYSTRFRFRIN
jgi:hypothetical protein